MFFRFSTKKIVQAVGVLLREARGRMEYLRLLKLLYIADREHLQSFLHPIVGTRLVAMKNGPLHSEVYNLVKGEHVASPLWSEFIRRDGHEIELLKDPGVSELSVAEIRTLTSTSDHYRTLSEWDIVEVTHDFPEWIANYPNEDEDTSCTISFVSLLDALDFQEKDKTAILEDLDERNQMNQLFAIS